MSLNVNVNSNVNSNGYLYLIEETKTINKIFSLLNLENEKKEKIEKFIPFLRNNEDLDKLVGKNILIGFRKPLLGIYGYATIKKIIDKNTNVNTNVNTDVNTDEKLFDKFVELYKLDCPSNLYFFELENLVEYKNIYKDKIFIKDLNVEVTNYNLNEIKFSKKMGNFEIEKIHSNQIIYMINEIHKNNLVSESEDSGDSGSGDSGDSGDSGSGDSDDSEDSDENPDFTSSPEDEEYKNIGFKLDYEKPENVIVMKIPILWIPCSNLKSIIKKEKITKNILQNHYRKCELCEINNNNNNDIEFVNIIFSFKDDESEKEMNEIIKYYKFLRNYVILRSEFSDNKYEVEKLNIIYYENYDEHIYNECLFILQTK